MEDIILKKSLPIALKVIAFLAIWIALAVLVPIPELSNDAVWRFFAELIPFAAVVIATVIMGHFEKPRLTLALINRPMKSAAVGAVVGLVWIGIPLAVLMLTGYITVSYYIPVSMLWLWCISTFLNTVMQELLVRGYMYQLIRRSFGAVSAVFVTTLLFVLMHGGIWEAGIISVLNVVTMSLLMSVVLERTQSLIAPIVMHFLWNSIGAVIFGAVTLADDYPYMLATVFHDNVLSGGIYRLENSILVLILNVLLIFFFAEKYGKGNRK